MAYDKTELLVGVATVKIGSAVLGYTRDGVKISYSRDRSDIECDQVRAPLYTEVTKEGAEISTTLMQISLVELKAAGILKSNGVLGLSAGEADASFAVEVYGTRKDGKLVKFTFPSCVINPGEITTTKADAATIALAIAVNYDDTTGGLGTMTET